MTFFSELRRRNIFRVALFYAVSGWLILQVADVLFGLLTVPDWTLKFVLGLLLLGFPFALVLAWIYEMTPEGVKKAREVERDTSITDHTGRKLTAATFAVLAWQFSPMTEFLPATRPPLRQAMAKWPLRPLPSPTRRCDRQLQCCPSSI